MYMHTAGLYSFFFSLHHHLFVKCLAFLPGKFSCYFQKYDAKPGMQIFVQQQCSQYFELAVPPALGVLGILAWMIFDSVL